LVSSKSFYNIFVPNYKTSKLAHTIVYIDSNSLYKSINYWFDNEISDATELSGFLHPTIKGISVDDCWDEMIIEKNVSLHSKNFIHEEEN